MARLVINIALLLFVTVLSVTQTASAEWYIKLSSGGHFIGPFGDEDMQLVENSVDYEVYDTRSVDLGAKDLVNLKVGHWFKDSFITRKFPGLDLGIEFELQHYTLNDSISFNQSVSAGYPQCAQYQLVYDWWTDSYIMVCAEWEQPPVYDVTYSVTGEEILIGVNFLLRNAYQASESFPGGRTHLYAGLGISIVRSEIDVTSNGVDFVVADNDTSANATILFGVDYMLASRFSVFLEINVTAVSHDYPLPLEGSPDGSTESYDTGSVYLAGISYHFF